VETDLTVLPKSSVPAAFDRGRLYSPTLDQTRYALDDRYIYDYRPGDLYEPMPAVPHGGTAWSRWVRNTARIEVPDFLGLRIGDDITLQHVTSVGPAVVVKAYRYGAVVRYPMPEGATEPYAETRVDSRTGAGHWY
jgi:hypothetical protein